MTFKFLLFILHFSFILALEDACGYLPDSNLQVKDFISWIQQRAQSCSTLWIHPGIYHITNPTRVETSARTWASTVQMLRLKHHLDDSLDYRIFGSTHLPFTFSLKNVVIDMTGVTFVMGNRSVGAIQVSQWINVTLKGLTIEYANYPTNQAHVDTVGVRGLEVTIPDGYPLDDWQSGKTFSCNVYLPGTRFLRIGSSDLRPTQILQNNGSVRSFRLVFSRPINGALEVGDTLGCRNAAFAFVFHVDGNTGCTFQDITLKGGPGFGFFHGHKHKSDGSIDPASLGSNRFIGLHLTYPEKPSGANVDPVLSSSADGFHVAGVVGGPTIKNSIIEGHNDDGIALHGKYSLVVDIKDNQIWVTSADYSVGDSLKLYTPGFQLAGEVTVIQVRPAQPAGKYAPPRNVSKTMPGVSLAPEPKQWYLILRVRGTIPKSLGFDWVAFSTTHSSSGFELSNNVIQNHRARGMLIKASNGIIRNNRIENSTLGGIIVTPELSWGEGDYVTNVTIANNSITSVCIGVQCFGGIALGATTSKRTFVNGPPYGHSDVIIIDNTFRNISQMNIWASSTQNLKISNNIFSDAYEYDPVAMCCPPYPFPKPSKTKRYISWITTSDEITVGKNCVVQTSDEPNIQLFWKGSTVRNINIVDGGFQRC